MMLLFAAASTSSSTAEMMVEVSRGGVALLHLFLTPLSDLATVEKLMTCLLLTVRHKNYN